MTGLQPATRYALSNYDTKDTDVKTGPELSDFLFIRFLG